MRQQVVVPWYEGHGDPRRLENYAVVTSRLRRGGFAPVVPDVAHWSRARARNAGARQVHGPTLVFNDADSVCPPEQINKAIWLAEEEPGLVFAYTLYLRLPDGARAPNGDEFPAKVSRIIEGSGSMACAAISRECFDEVGGFDEAYEGWGYEDLDFTRRCAEMWPLRRVDGPVYHLFHGERRDDDSPADCDPVMATANLERWRRTASTV